MEKQSNKKDKATRLQTFCRIGIGGLIILTINALQMANAGTELKVTGELTKPGCQIEATKQGVYELGKLERAASTRILPSMTQAWIISCESETYLSITPLDNRHGISTTDFMLNDSYGNVVGSYQMRVDNIKVDQLPKMMGLAGQQSKSSNTLQPSTRTDWLAVDGARQAGSTFAVDITVLPHIDVPKSVMASGEPIVFNGVTTLSFMFGL